jgi:hypothetical protein
MMVRTQIALPAEDHRLAKRRAAELNVSLAEYVRRAVRRDLGAAGSAVDVSAAFGLFDSGGSDIARDKDAYIGEAFETGYRRQTGQAEDGAEASHER